jgi:hypothetical protein
MKRCLLVTLLTALLPLTALPQGQLPPPAGAPGPTMKTLDQLDAKLDTTIAKVDTANTNLGQVDAKTEKRIPIDAAHTPGDQNYEFIINQSGSYYLTGNVNVVKQYGIHVASSGVTLDLNGFQVKGGTASKWGIEVDEIDCTVRNGSISGFQDTGLVALVRATNGTASNLIISGNKFNGLNVSDGWHFIDCLCRDNGGPGFTFGDYCLLKKCAASNNAGPGILGGTHCGLFECSTIGNKGGGTFPHFGIRVGAGSTVVECVSASNTGGTSTPNASNGGGILTGAGSTIRNCTVEVNAGDGIQTGDNSNVSGCTSTNNGAGTTGSGIATGIRVSVSGCSAIGNKGDGIVFSGDSFVINNHASTNGGAGFHDVGSASRIDGNVSRENIGTGILAATGDTVVRNNSGANGNGAANNQYGPTAGANWGPVSTANTATSPWANF